MERCPHRFAAVGDDGKRLLIHRPEGDARLRDARLLPGDALNGLAQEFRVLALDVGDDRNLGQEDVGGIQPSSHAHLDNGDVDRALLEVSEGKGGGELEEGGLVRLPLGPHRPRVGPDGLGHPDDIVVGNGLPIHPDALVEADQMGRGVEAHPIPRLSEDGVEEGAHGSLPLAPCDMDAGKGLMRVPEAP